MDTFFVLFVITHFPWCFQNMKKKWNNVDKNFAGTCRVHVVTRGESDVNLEAPLDIQGMLELEVGSIFFFAHNLHWG